MILYKCDKMMSKKYLKRIHEKTNEKKLVLIVEKKDVDSKACFDENFCDCACCRYLKARLKRFHTQY
jgi:hypothetical protein